MFDKKRADFQSQIRKQEVYDIFHQKRPICEKKQENI